MAQIPIRMSPRWQRIRQMRRNPQNIISVNISHVVNPNIVMNNQKHSFNKIKLSHLNVQSIRNRNNLIQVRELVVDEKIDILALSETWINSSTTNAEIKIQEYNIYRLDRKNKKGGGVCIYVRNDFKRKVLKNLSYISPVGFHQLWLQIQVNKNKSMIVCVTYRPPDCPVTCIRDELKPKFIEALLLGKEIIILGDMNCNPSLKHLVMSLKYY